MQGRITRTKAKAHRITQQVHAFTRCIWASAVPAGLTLTFALTRQ